MAKQETKITVINVTHYHMPDSADWDDVEIGMTLRQALQSLRHACRRNYGNIGEMTADLSDGTILEICLKSAVGGGQLMSSQEITRREQVDTASGWRTIQKYQG